MRQCFAIALSAFVLGFSIFTEPAAHATGLEPAYNQELLGPQRAMGAVVWNHGRSVNSEDSEAPTPPYMAALKDRGWDTFRFNRMRVDDTLPHSAAALVDLARQLKAQGG